MHQLLEGVHKFREGELGQYQELFHRLSREGQNPHTLFITCSDSRILAELITQSQPGDLFVVKNIGNIVPASGSERVPSSTAAAIEFAVDILAVQDIVVCGHSCCGAMAALLDGIPEQKTKPYLSEWLELASSVRKLIECDYQHLVEPEARSNAAAQENVLFALENLRTYPSVKRRLNDKSLRLHGWFFKIATAEMYAYNFSVQQFEIIKR